MGRSTTLERRFTTTEFEVRRNGASQLHIEGYAAVFNSRSQDLGGFVEEIRPTAFNKTIKEADVRALWNHNPNLLLGRNRAGTLDLATDSHGLLYRVLLPDTSYANDLRNLMDREDINQSSFAFFLAGDNGDEWTAAEDGGLLRYLNEVSLLDVSVVTYPAYEQSTSELARGAHQSLARRCGVETVDLSDTEAVKAILASRQSPPNEPDNSTQDDKTTRQERAQKDLRDAEADIERIANFFR